ncbi:MAG: hypothetical protein WD513_06550 [Balneolaceae bacterium]
MNINIPDNKLKVIEKAIASDQSVVGIDAKKTHIIIIHMLDQIQQRLDSMESRLNDLDKKTKVS